MTPRERVLSVLDGRKPDCVPWLADLDYYATALIARGQKPKGFQDSGEYIAWHRDLGVGFYQQASWPYKEIRTECEEREWWAGQARHREIITPEGTLHERWQWSDQTVSQAPVERLVKSADDLGAYRFLMEHTQYQPDYSAAVRRQGQVAEMGLVMCFLPWSPLMRMMVADAGIETVVMALADAPAEMEETLRVVKASLDRASTVAVASPAEVLMITENLSSEVVGERLFERRMRDSYLEWSRKMRAGGAYSCIHMDGTLAGLLRQVSSVGFTFIEAMTPAPVGDVAVKDWHRYRNGGNTISWSGIPGSFEDFGAC